MCGELTVKNFSAFECNKAGNNRLITQNWLLYLYQQIGLFTRAVSPACAHKFWSAYSNLRH